MQLPNPDDVPINWVRCLSRLVDTMPRPLVEGIPALKIAIEQAHAVLNGPRDQETCKALYERVEHARLLR